MPRKNPRLYRMTDAELIQLADRLHGLLERDADAFATRQIDSDERASLAGTRDALADTPTDEEYVADAATALGEVKSIRAAAADCVRIIRSMAQAAFADDGRYAAFGFGKMHAANDEAYYRALRRVCRVGGRFLDQLAGHGLTQAMLNALADKAAELDEALDIHTEKEEDRLIATAGRVGTGNKLYTLVSRICLVGQSLFYTESEAKYNDYLLPS